MRHAGRGVAASRKVSSALIDAARNSAFPIALPIQKILSAFAEREAQMQARDQIDEGRQSAPTVLEADQARQGVTGNNVRYVLYFGLLGIIVGFTVLGILAAHGWLAAS
jgi:hypothetical protein